MLKKLLLKPGVNRENTRYTTEGGWFDCEKVRFRQGNPEKIGGWTRVSTSTFLGVCRSLWAWVTLAGVNSVGVLTHLKCYIEVGGGYNDITPIRETASLNNPFATTNTSTTVTVTDVAHGAITGDYVTFSGAATVGGLDLNAEYSLTKLTADTYTITASSAATSTVAAGGGAAVSAAYQINIGLEGATTLSGWGASTWGSGPWGTGTPSAENIRIWSQSNFGEDLVFALYEGPIYYWDATGGLTTRGVLLSSLGGASGVPAEVGLVMVTDNRFVMAFGSYDAANTAYNPMLVRWSDQDSAVNWTPAVDVKAGEIQLARGSSIMAALQTRQEILVFTDAALYTLQYQGYPAWWGATLMADNVSIVSPTAVAQVNGVAFWMGIDKFYTYDGTVRTLNCDLRKYIFTDINRIQGAQIFTGVNEEFNEVWWFYCSEDSDDIDRYVVYNYYENTWYNGSMARTAWLDTGLRDYPVAATYVNNLVYHEYGCDDDATGTPAAISASITSSQFDLDDGHNFMFIDKVIPDMTFVGSTAASPAATITLYPLNNSGAGYTDPASEGGNSSGAVTRTVDATVEEYTEQIYVRVRGRQMAMKISSTALGVAWQAGATRLNMRPDGRR